MHSLNQRGLYFRQKRLRIWEPKNVPAVLEVELPLRHRLSGNNMSGIMLLDSFSGTNFHYPISALSRVFEHVVRLTVIGVQTVEVCHF